VAKTLAPCQGGDRMRTAAHRLRRQWKTAIASEICDVLAELEIPNVAIDLDALTWQWPASGPWNNDLVFGSPEALWKIHRKNGTTHLTLARVLQDRTEVDRYLAAVPGAQITICRVTGPEQLRIERLVNRMPPGPSRDWHLARTKELESILESLALEDFVVENDSRPLRVAALEVLQRAGWLEAP
jgi:hypothetical protein